MSLNETPLRVIIGSDHAGVAAKEKLVKYLLAKETDTIEDVGTFSEASVDYPDIAAEVCRRMLVNIENFPNTRGILICGTGIGVSIAANKVIVDESLEKRLGVTSPHVFRACVCSETISAEMARKHNNANIVCLGARTTSVDAMQNVVNVFLKTEFEGGRHETRIHKFGERITEESVEGMGEEVGCVR
mmetsp:Transcript_32749/g.51187  ORF Transcript_32749/g.51187 Transcript_32749/m.51187 type:complete len:188 (-) Transcript_32749:75-638(-)